MRLLHFYMDAKPLMSICRVTILLMIALTWDAAHLHSAFICPHIKLVSVGIDEPYESTLNQLRAVAANIGFSSTQLWRRQELYQDPFFVDNRHAFDELSFKKSLICKKFHRLCRPFCMAIKAIALLRAMTSIAEGDYVMWTDASRHINYSSADLRDLNACAAVEHLQNRRAQSMYGMVECTDLKPACDQDLCEINSDGIPPLVEEATIWGFRHMIPDVPRFMNSQHILTANLLLQNTRYNRMLVQSWLNMALQHPQAFCASSWTQDQAAWTILAFNLSLPLVNPCQNHRARSRISCSKDITQSDKAHQEVKDLTYVIRVLQNGLYLEDSFDRPVSQCRRASNFSSYYGN